MKKYLFILTLVAAAVISLTAQSCSHEEPQHAGVLKNVSMAEFKEMAREAFDNGNDVKLSYDSLNSRVILRSQAPANNDDFTIGESVSDNIVALTAVILGVLMPGAVTISIFFIFFRYLRRRRLDRYRVIEHAIDRGMQLPGSFYLSESMKNTNTPRSAIVWIGWGLAIITFFLCTTNRPLAAFGLIPLFIGIARGVTYLINRHDKNIKDRCEREALAPLFPEFDEESEQK